ncbi:MULTISPECIES: PP2C family serine/threonine-protein phosphatase [unclassified Acinetobacter]|uniref:PP2C family serine/threonine-protein phosphatase n=1 Tax=unclassified Acinetobacter TaxID=196816 RepID=UPI0035BAF821
MAEQNEHLNSSENHQIKDIVQAFFQNMSSDDLAYLCRQPTVYNAVYDLAEVIYTEHQICDANDVLAQILLQGRLATFDRDALQQRLAQQQFSENNLCLFENNAEQDEVEKAEHSAQQALAVATADSTEAESTDIDSIEIDSTKTDSIAEPISDTLLATNQPKSDDLKAPILDSSLDNSLDQAAATATSDSEKVKMPFFKVDIAHVGKAYQSKIRMHSPIEQDIDIIQHQVHFPEQIGLTFDAATQMIVGQPSQDGEFLLSFDYIDPQTQQKHAATVQLIVIANPADMWKDVEPDATVAYGKPHTEMKSIVHDDYHVYATRRRGRSHAHAGTYCDDDFHIQRLQDSDWSILIAADGAGSAKFSRLGSKLACDTVGDVLRGFLADKHSALDELLSHWKIGQGDDVDTQNAANELFNYFYRQFQTASLDAIKAIEHEANKIDAKPRDFATTLLIAVVKKQADKTFIASFAVGDGAICAYSAEHVVLMNQPDGGEYAGQTQFLSPDIYQDASRTNIRYLSGDYSVMLMTDGISDPKFDTDANLQSAEKWHEFWQQDILPNLAQANPNQALLDWSHFFAKGHHDDRTLLLLTASQHVQNLTDSIAENQPTDELSISEQMDNLIQNMPSDPSTEQQLNHPTDSEKDSKHD